jgi:hypothetical protein
MILPLLLMAAKVGPSLKSKVLENREQGVRERREFNRRSLGA